MDELLGNPEILDTVTQINSNNTVFSIIFLYSFCLEAMSHEDGSFGNNIFCQKFEPVSFGLLLFVTSQSRLYVTPWSTLIPYTETTERRNSIILEVGKECSSRLFIFPWRNP